MWGLFINQCSARMEAVMHMMGAEKSHSFHETKDMTGLWQEEHNGCLFFSRQGLELTGVFWALALFLLCSSF